MLYQLSYLGVNPIVSAARIGGNRRSSELARSARTEAWIEKQAAPSLAAVFANKGGDMDYLQELLTEGRKRWGEKHRLIADGLA